MIKNWSNTVLVAYSLLPKIAKELDYAVKTRVDSSFQGKHFKLGVGTEQLISEIIELTDEKRKIVNLRFIVTQALKKLDVIERAYLIARVTHKYTYQRIANETSTTLRTAFRKVTLAEKHFAENLKKMGYGEEWLAKEYGSSHYVAQIYKRIMGEKYFTAKSL